MIPMLWERSYPGNVGRTDHLRDKPESRNLYVLTLECGYRVAKAAALENKRGTQ